MCAASHPSRSIVLKNLLRKPEAIEAALLSLQSYPWNWSAWRLLWDLVDDHNVLIRMKPLLPPSDHPMTRIFLIGVMIESHAMTEELEEDLDRLVEMWPDSLHIRTLQAHYAYSIRGEFLRFLFVSVFSKHSKSALSLRSFIRLRPLT